MLFNLSTLLFFILALLAEILGTVSGFGSSAYILPLTQWFYDAHTALALTGILHVFSNGAKLVLFHKGVVWSLVWQFGAPSLAFSIAGAWLNTVVDVSWANGALGLFLFVFAGLLLWKRDLQMAPTTTNALLCGALAGFLAGFLGTGGAVRGAGMAAFGLEKNVFVAVSSLIDLGVDLSRSIIYVNDGYLKPELYGHLPVLFIVAALGSYLGKRILARVSEEFFRRIVLVSVVAIGLLLMVKWGVQAF